MSNQPTIPKPEHVARLHNVINEAGTQLTQSATALKKARYVLDELILPAYRRDTSEEQAFNDGLSRLARCVRDLHADLSTLQERHRQVVDEINRSIGT